MTQMTFRLIELLFSQDHLRIVHITASRNTQTLHIQVHILHVFRRDVELVIRKPHHTSLIDLNLTFTYFFRITTVRNTHITREAQFDRQVEVLRLITRKPDTRNSFLCDIVYSSANSVFRIITFGSQCDDFISVDGHHLSHSHMAQRNTYCAE